MLCGIRYAAYLIYIIHFAPLTCDKTSALSKDYYYIVQISGMLSVLGFGGG
jgi:hypothetical protein